MFEKSNPVSKLFGYEVATSHHNQLFFCAVKLCVGLGCTNAYNHYLRGRSETEWEMNVHRINQGGMVTMIDSFMQRHLDLTGEGAHTTCWHKFDVHNSS